MCVISHGVLTHEEKMRIIERFFLQIVEQQLSTILLPLSQVILYILMDTPTQKGKIITQQFLRKSLVRIK